MKKLMTMLAAVATAFGLFATDDGFKSGAGFDTSDTTKYTWTYDTVGSTGVFNTAYWSGITAGNAIIKSGTPVASDSEDRPSEFIVKSGRSYDGYLEVATTMGNPISQFVKENGDAQPIGGGLYFDGLVKFTTFDEIPTNTYGTTAKVGVFVYQQDTDAGDAPKKLFVYAAGSDTNYYETATEIDDSVWHRLTIKMIAEIGSGHNTGYVIFIDGVAVECPAAKLDDSTLLPAAKEWNQYGSLFEGLTEGTGISAIDFDGKGSIDEIAFTTTVPFDAAKDSNFFTLSWTADVTGFTCQGLTTNGLTEAGSYTFDLGKDIDPATYTVSVTGITYNEDVYGSKTAAFTASAKEGALASTAASKATFNGAGYASVAAALIDANAIKQAGTYTLKMKEGSDALSFENATADVNLILDLNGRTITQGEADEAAIILSAGSLKIVDGSDGKTGVVAGNGKPEGASVAVSAFDGVLEIVDGTYNGVVGVSTLTISSTTPKFSYADNLGEAGACGITVTTWSGDAQGKELVADGVPATYWIVGNAAPAKGTVIFICGKTELETEPAEVEPGVVTPPAIDATGIYTAEGWYSDQGLTNPAELTIAAGETKTFYAKAQIVFAQDDGKNVIASVTDIKKLAAAVADGNDFDGVAFKQTASIDMTEVGPWAGIGGTFKGDYDGQGNTISNIKFTDRKYAGFFNNVAGNTIENLVIENVDFVGEAAEYGHAAFIGQAVGDAVTCRNLTFKGTYGHDGAYALHTAGGIAVKFNNGSLIACTNLANIVGARDNDNQKVGGLVGFCQNGGGTGAMLTFDNCYNGGNISYVGTGHEKANGFGGILGAGDKGAVTLKDCESTGTVTSAPKTDYDKETGLGTLIGYMTGPVTIQGVVKAPANAAPVSALYTTGDVSALAFATVENGVATFAPITKDGTVFTAMLDSAETNTLAATQTVAIKDGPGAFTGEWEAADESVVVAKTTPEGVQTWTASAAVASVGGVGYATFEGALAAAKANETITLRQNAILAGDPTIAVENLTLDLGGKTLTKPAMKNDNASKITVSASGFTMRNGGYFVARTNNIEITGTATGAVRFENVEFDGGLKVATMTADKLQFIGCAWTAKGDDTLCTANFINLTATGVAQYEFVSCTNEYTGSSFIMVVNAALTTKFYVEDCVFNDTKTNGAPAFQFQKGMVFFEGNTVNNSADTVNSTAIGFYKNYGTYFVMKGNTFNTKYAYTFRGKNGADANQTGDEFSDGTNPIFCFYGNSKETVGGYPAISGGVVTGWYWTHEIVPQEKYQGGNTLPPEITSFYDWDDTTPVAVIDAGVVTYYANVDGLQENDVFYLKPGATVSRDGFMIQDVNERALSKKLVSMTGKVTFTATFGGVLSSVAYTIGGETKSITASPTAIIVEKDAEVTFKMISTVGMPNYDVPVIGGEDGAITVLDGVYTIAADGGTIAFNATDCTKDADTTAEQLTTAIIANGNVDLTPDQEAAIEANVDDLVDAAGNAKTAAAWLDVKGYGPAGTTGKSITAADLAGFKEVGFSYTLSQGTGAQMVWFTEEPTVEFTEAVVSSEAAGAMDMTIALDGAREGDEDELAAAITAKIANFVKCSLDLDDWTTKPEISNAKANDDNTVSFTVKPTGATDKGFTKIVLIAD